MVTLNAFESFFAVALSLCFANTVNTQQTFETLFNQTRGIDPHKYSKVKIFNQGTNHSYAPASLFTCICIAPYDYNASLPVLDSNHVSDIQPRNSSFKFKILLCPKRNVYCSIWKPYKEPRTTNICNYEEDKLKINVKEARNRKKSCTSLLKGKGMGHHETITNKNKSEKIELISPIIKANQAKAIFLLYSNSTLSIKKLPNVLQVGTTSTNTSFQRGGENKREVRNRWSTWMKRARRSTTLSLQPMIFPRVNRKLLERKRNGKKEMNATVQFSGGMLMTNLTEIKGQIIFNNDTGHFHHHSRDKRETQILYAKYSKTKKSSRKKRPKPASPSSRSCDDDKYDNVSSSPYTFLNVSFTGYWEPPERTTVKPRIRRPLKMTDQDRNFVYGDDDQKNEKSDRGRNKGKSSGWSSKIKINFRS